MPTRLVEGDVIAKAYRIVRLLGSGGMGEVYVAEQLATGRERALKIMHARLQDDPALRDRFVREARVASRIQSTHCIEVIDAGVERETGTPWIAMELLEGQSLGSLVRDQGALSPPAVAKLLKQIGHAVGQAHQVGVVHRDLKPENIFIAESHDASETERVKVLDFGIAKSMEASPTQATEPVGSPAWMAPEQADVGKATTPATDVWSLGLLVFWMLTGSSYWRSAAHEKASMHAFLKEILFDVLPSASERAATLGCQDRLPDGFDAWFERCVHREPRARFTDADSLVAAFVGLVDPNQAAPEQPAIIQDVGELDTVAFAESQGLDIASSSTSAEGVQHEAPPESDRAAVFAETSSHAELQQSRDEVIAAERKEGAGLVVIGGILLLAAAAGLAAFWLPAGQAVVTPTSPPSFGTSATSRPAIPPPPAPVSVVVPPAKPPLACGDLRCKADGAGICCWDNYRSSRATQGACSSGNIAGDNCATTDSAELKRGHQTRIECQNSSQCGEGKVCCARLFSAGYKGKPYFERLFCAKECALPLRKVCDRKTDGGTCPRLPLGAGTIQAECKATKLLPPGYFVCGYPVVR